MAERRRAQHGQRYRAVVGLSYPTDPDVVARLLAGENLPYKERGTIKEVEAGDIVDDIPESSIAGLLAKGRIEAVDDTDGKGNGGA